MLRAYDGMPSDEFISQLRTFVIALGLGPQVVDQVDKLTSTDDLEDAHEEELNKVEDEAVKRGRSEMQREIFEAVTSWVESEAPREDIVKLIEGLE